MKLLWASAGIILSGVSAGVMAGNSSVSIGAIGGGVNVVTSGQGGTNRINISGDSIKLGAVTSIVGSDGTRSEIQIGGMLKQEAAGSECDAASHKVSISGVGRSAQIDASKVEALCVSGSNNQVTARYAGALTLISLSGVRNVVKVEKNLEKLVLHLGGVSNTVYLSQQADVQVIRSGTGNKVIRF